MGCVAGQKGSSQTGSKHVFGQIEFGQNGLFKKDINLARTKRVLTKLGSFFKWVILENKRHQYGFTGSVLVATGEDGGCGVGS